MEGSTQKREVNSVRKALNILDHVFAAQGEVSLSDICHSLDLNRATAYQLLTTLCACGYVYQKRDTKGYVLGSKAFMLSHSNSFINHLIVETHPILNEIAAVTSETVHLAIRSAAEMVFLDKVESLMSLRAITDLQQHPPIHCCSVGKAILAYLSDAELRMVLQSIRWHRHTDHTIMSADELLRQLDSVRELGYSIDDEEYFIGLRCVAVPILNRFNAPICAIGISAPAQRLPDFSAYGAILLEKKRKLEDALFYRNGS